MAPKKTSSDCKRTRRGGKGGAQKETAPCCLSPSLSISLVSLLARSLLTALSRSSAFPLTVTEAEAAGKAAADDSIDKGRRTDGRADRWTMGADRTPVFPSLQRRRARNSGSSCTHCPKAFHVSCLSVLSISPFLPPFVFAHRANPVSYGRKVPDRLRDLAHVYKP